MNDLRALWSQWMADNKDVPINLEECNTFKKLKVYYFQFICDGGCFKIVGSDDFMDPNDNSQWPIQFGAEIDINSNRGLALYRNAGFDSDTDRVLQRTIFSTRDFFGAFGRNFQGQNVAELNFEQFCSLNPTDAISGVQLVQKQVKGKIVKVWKLVVAIGASQSGLHDSDNPGIEIEIPFETAGTAITANLYR